jgi:hypothetical protein
MAKNTLEVSLVNSKEMQKIDLVKFMLKLVVFLEILGCLLGQQKENTLIFPNKRNESQSITLLQAFIF